MSKNNSAGNEEDVKTSKIIVGYYGLESVKIMVNVEAITWTH